MWGVFLGRSVQIRVDDGYARMLKEMQQSYSRKIGKPITVVQVTRILKDEPNKSVVFYRKRGKQVQI